MVQAAGAVVSQLALGPRAMESASQATSRRREVRLDARMARSENNIWAISKKMDTVEGRIEASLKELRNEMIELFGALEKIFVLVDWDALLRAAKRGDDAVAPLDP